MNEADQRAALLRVVAGRPGPVVPDAVTWGQWVALARIERVLPLLHELVDTVPTDLLEEQREQIHYRQQEVLSHVVHLEHHLVDVAARCARHDLRVAVLKGAATAHLDYPDPSWREFADIDLLVDPADRERAITVLGTDGWSQRYALPPGHEDFTHAVTLQRGGVELDLHQRIAHRSLGVRVSTAELLGRSIPYEVAGAELRALDAIDRLIHAVIHMSTSRGRYRRLSSAADVLLMAEARVDDARDTLARAERWRLRPVVEHGLLDAYEAAMLPLHPAWADAMCRPIRTRDRFLDHAYLGARRRPVTEEVAYLRVLPGWRTRWRYVRGYFGVGADYAAQHGRSGFTAQARYALSRLRSKE